VTLDNIGACFADGARVFVGGSAIIGQADVRGIIREFRAKIAYARHKLLIQKAHELGGKDLVAKWIDLHAVGDKKNQLSLVAKELGYT
jgi:transketolase